MMPTQKDQYFVATYLTETFNVCGRFGTKGFKDKCKCVQNVAQNVVSRAWREVEVSTVVKWFDKCVFFFKLKDSEESKAIEEID